MDRSGIVLAIVIICCLSAALSMVIEEDKLRSVIGIDLGTSSYCVAVYMNGHVEIIPNDEGNRTTPTWVAFTDSDMLIGEAAKNQAAVNAQRTIFDVRRLIGREFEDKEVQSLMKLVPYKIVNKDGMPYIQVEIKDGETKVFSPEEISAMILTKIKETTEASLGKKITDVVVPVPSYFSDEQRQATEDAGLIAGFNVVTVIGETMAAAYAYGLHEEKTAEKTILVFNLGDGTFDVTILQIETGDFIFHLARTHLGGEDLNQRIMEYLIKLIKNKYGKDVSKDSTGALVNLRMEAERAIRALSSQHQVRVNLFDDLSEPLTFEELNKDLLMELMNKVMEDAPLEKHQIDGIILVGGNTNIPKVQQFLRDYFNGRVEPKTSVNPDEAVAIGAVVAGDLLIKDAGRSSMC